MGKKLAYTVYLDGECYKAGTCPPADVAKRITNESAWEQADAEAPAEKVTNAGPEFKSSKK